MKRKNKMTNFTYSFQELKGEWYADLEDCNKIHYVITMEETDMGDRVYRLYRYWSNYGKYCFTFIKELKQYSQHDELFQLMQICTNKQTNESTLKIS